MQLSFKSDRRIKRLTNKNTWILSFMFTYILAFTLFLHVVQVISSIISFQPEGLWSVLQGKFATNEFSQFFYLSENILISPSFLQDSVANIEFLIDLFFFSFSTLNALSCCFWPPWFLWDISYTSYWGSLECDGSILSCCFWDSLFVFQSLIMVWLGVALFLFLLCGVCWAS